MEFFPLHFSEAQNKVSKGRSPEIDLHGMALTCPTYFPVFAEPLEKTRVVINV